MVNYNSQLSDELKKVTLRRKVHFLYGSHFYLKSWLNGSTHFALQPTII